MAVVWIPSMMRELTAGQEKVRAPGATLGEVIEAIERVHPGVRDRLLSRGGLAPGVMAMVDGKRALRGLQEHVGEESEVRFLPIMAGG